MNPIQRLSIFLVVAASISTVEARSDERPSSKSDRVLAIDVLLTPNATMNEKAETANARLRENYPKCYTLGKNQLAHITLVHGYVRESDLPQLEADVSKLAEAAQPLKWELTANEYTYAIWAGVAITTTGIERTRELDAFQEKIAKAIGRYAVADGTAAAFSTNRELPHIDKDIIDYVKNFARNSSGQKYHPHVTIGVAHEDFVKRMKAEPFKKFTFKPAALRIYQLGNFGTAQKKLWQWDPDKDRRRNK
jgi:2'-5' RNA ligase